MRGLTHPDRDATCETTTFQIWHGAVLEIARVSAADANRYVTRERIQLAYQAGEPVWMMADEVELRVTVGRREDRADAEVDGLRRALQNSP